MDMVQPNVPGRGYIVDYQCGTERTRKSLSLVSSNLLRSVSTASNHLTNQRKMRHRNGIQRLKFQFNSNAFRCKNKIAKRRTHSLD
jgi:hypothetical protein